MTEVTTKQRKRKSRHQPPVSLVAIEAEMQRVVPNFWVPDRALHALAPA